MKRVPLALAPALLHMCDVHVAAWTIILRCMMYITCYTHVVACLIAIVRLEKVWSCMHPWSVRIWPLRRPSVKANLLLFRGGCSNPPYPLRRGPTEDPVFNGLLSATTGPRPTLSTPPNNTCMYCCNMHVMCTEKHVYCTLAKKH